MATPRSGSFPDTQAVWIGDRLGEGEDGVKQVVNHVMEWYLHPLVTYCRAIRLGASLRTEPEDLVDGYFASRLSDPEHLSEWLRSGLRLRHWLKNGLHFFVREEVRRRSMIDRIEPPGLDPSSEGGGTIENQAGAFDRGWASTVLFRATESVKDELHRKGRSSDWEVFWGSRIEGIPYDNLARSHRITIVQARNKVFAVAERLRGAMREVLVRDGAKPHEVNEDIRAMMAAVQEGPHHG